MSIMMRAGAYAWGRSIAGYSQWQLEHARVYCEGIAEVPADPVIWAGWHATNLIALAVYVQLHRGRTCQAFVAPGLAGATMRGWLDGIGGFETVVLPPDGTGNMRAGLKHMPRAMARGSDVVIAVDGPRGPAGQVRPGAFWLARITGCPLVPAAFAARPALRMPRWDHQLVPLPRATIGVVFGTPIQLGRGTAVDAPQVDTLSAALQATTRRAWELVDSPPFPRPPTPHDEENGRKKL